jgi:hypothetical protein
VVMLSKLSPQSGHIGAVVLSIRKEGQCRASGILEGAGLTFWLAATRTQGGLLAEERLELSTADAILVWPLSLCVAIPLRFMHESDPDLTA